MNVTFSFNKFQICERVQHEGWTVVQDEEGRMGPFAYKENQWVSYDDKAMIKYKVSSITVLI